MLNSTGKTASLCLCVRVCQRRVYDNGARWWIQREFHGRSRTYQQLTASPGNRVAGQYVTVTMHQRPLSLSLSSRLAVCQTTQLQVVARHPCPEPTPTVHPCYVLSV